MFGDENGHAYQVWIVSVLLCEDLCIVPVYFVVGLRAGVWVLLMVYKGLQLEFLQLFGTRGHPHHST